MTKLSQLLNILTGPTFDQTFTASSFADTPHNLGTIPPTTILQRSLGSGDWETLEFGNYLTVSNTTIKEAGLNSLGSDLVRIIVSVPAGIFSSVASSTQQGIVSTGTQTFAGLKTFADGFKYGNQAENFYETQDLVLQYTANNPGSTATNQNVKLSRTGNQVTMQLERIDGTLSTASIFGTATGNIPVTYLPAVEVQVPMIISDNGISQVGIIGISPSGAVFIFSDEQFNAFNSSGSYTLRSHTVSWITS